MSDVEIAAAVVSNERVAAKRTVPVETG
jgi:hypothetical protein